jgi:Na+/citrate or Na+/malate symporter
VTSENLVLTALRSLAAVNFFLAIVGIVQLTRIGMYQSSQKSAGEIVEGMKEDVKETVAEAKTEVKEAVKN